MEVLGHFHRTYFLLTCPVRFLVYLCQARSMAEILIRAVVPYLFVTDPVYATWGLLGLDKILPRAWRCGILVICSDGVIPPPLAFGLLVALLKHWLLHKRPCSGRLWPLHPGPCLCRQQPQHWLKLGARETNRQTSYSAAESQ